MTRLFRILTFGLCLTTVGLLFFECKRHRKIDVEGTVTDEYTGQPVSNLRIKLHSSIKNIDKFNSDIRTYYTYTDSEGKYNFTNAFFSKPNFYGYTVVSDENGSYGSWDSDPITKKDAKLIGETKLTRNLVTTCFSNLNITLSVSNAYTWYLTTISEKFIGSHPIATFNDFGNSIGFGHWETSSKLMPILGYADGKTILKTEVKTNQDVILATKYDTISSSGCGSAVNYTITVN